MEEEVRRLVAAHLSGHRVRSVAWLGAGMENDAYLVNDDLIVRFSKETDADARAVAVVREARLLAAVAGVATVPVPQPLFTAPDRGCLAYPVLSGVPLLEVPRPLDPGHAEAIGATLGALLTALHAADPRDFADLVPHEHEPMADWLADARECYATSRSVLTPGFEPAVQAFLAAAPPADDYRPVFSHNDLGIEHVIVDPAGMAVTGVIDWGDAAICDPAYDFGLLYRDLGTPALAAALHAYAADGTDVAALRERAVYYARCSVFEDLAYGLETGRRAYVEKGLVALPWLFEAS